MILSGIERLLFGPEKLVIAKVQTTGSPVSGRTRHSADTNFVFRVSLTRNSLLPIGTLEDDSDLGPQDFIF